MTTTEKPVRIVKLQTANVKRLQAVEIEPNGKAVVIIGGKNGAGKSSVLDSISMALGGKAEIPPDPVRKGQRRAKTNVYLDNGLCVTREFDASGTRLKITDENGDQMKSPQTILDKLVGALAFDPLEYMRKKATEQAALLRTIAGVDTMPLDARRQKLYEERTDKGRDLSRDQKLFEAAVHHLDAPAEEVSVATLTDELTELQRQASANAKQRADAQTNAERAEQGVRDCEAAVKRIENELVELRAKIAQLEAARVENVAALATVGEHKTAAREKLDAARALTDPDTAPVREQLKSAEAVNAKVRDNRARAELERKVKAGEEERERLTLEIERIDFEKTDMLKAAKLPVPGLGFDGDIVTLDGIPLEQASQAERLRVSVAMGIAMNPRLRVLLVRDGALLDEDSLRLLADMATAAESQVWLEVVGDRADCHVVIEDGNVRKEAAGADAAE